MTPMESDAIDAIDDAIEEAIALSRTTGIIPSLRYQALPYNVFEHYREETGATPHIQKCQCGHCGNLIVAFECAFLADSDAGEDDARGATVGFVRSATEQETLDELERMVR